MSSKTFTYLIGGKAGEGVKKAGETAANLFASQGRAVFVMDDYQSLIRGGHNFCVVSTAKDVIHSHYLKAQLVICLDQRSYDLHKEHVAPDGFLIYNSDAVKNAGQGIGVPMATEAKKYPGPHLGLRLGVAGAAILAAAICFKEKELAELIKNGYPKDLENNIAYAKDIYQAVCEKIAVKFPLEKGRKTLPLLTGNEAIALGAAVAGLDMYFAYPMTPASSILHYLAKHAKELGVAVIHPENEIAVLNMAIGASMAGARTMVGTSGGGFALMEEAFSLAGITETPVVCVLSQRPGPATGVPTYTEQGDLKFAINAGHGEFTRIVASPVNAEEAFYLTAELLDMVWRFQIPGILLTEKHLSESRMSADLLPDKAKWPEPLMHKEGEYKRYLDAKDGISPLQFPPYDDVIKWNSYEHDEIGITTDEPAAILKMKDKRNRKHETLLQYLRKMKTVNVYGDQGPIIYTYGSTTMSVLEALKVGEIRARVVQPIYLEPFPVWEFEQFKNEQPTVVECSATGIFAQLLQEKTGQKPKAVIKRYDGRPFEPSELAKIIKKMIND